jgi:hypothetical protein
LDAKEEAKVTKVLKGKFTLHMLNEGIDCCCMSTREEYVINIDEHKKFNAATMKSK